MLFMHHMIAQAAGFVPIWDGPRRVKRREGGARGAGLLTQHNVSMEFIVR